jgi:hypothetical protein
MNRSKAFPENLTYHVHGDGRSAARKLLLLLEIEAGSSVRLGHSVLWHGALDSLSHLENTLVIRQPYWIRLHKEKNACV